jgi:hypothetical protein
MHPTEFLCWSERILASPVHPEQRINFASADADAAGRDVRVSVDVSLELGDQRLAEPFDIAVGLSGWIEIGSALRTAHRKYRQRVLPDFVEAEEIEGGKVDVETEAKTAVVSADRAVELDAVTPIDCDVRLSNS